MYALQNKISYGAVQNQAGEFVNPEVKSVTAAAAGAMPTMPKDFRVSITNSPGQGAYPISSFTWILLYENPENKEHARVMNDFVKWALSDGQPMAETLGYARLPEALVTMELEQLNRIESAVKSGSDLGFRVVTGAFARARRSAIVVVDRRRRCSANPILSIREFGLDFWITDVWDPVAAQFGARPFIWGTLYSSVLALLIAAPISLGIATYLSELCPAALRQPLIFLTELLAAIPSIVYGLWGIFVLVPLVRALETPCRSGCATTPLFSGPPIGLGLLAAALSSPSW